MKFITSVDVLAHLCNLGLFHIDLTLARVQYALQNLGMTRPPFAVVQIVGTNGKGSTAAFLSALTQAHGLRTGLFTSPHLVCPSERIRVNGKPVPLDTWPPLANRVFAACPDLTYFEFCTVLALLAFAEQSVDVAVLEAGMGGRFDATTAVIADVLCVTSISMDHESVLGNTLEAIATDKAGAVRADTPLVLAEQAPEVVRIFEDAARACASPLYYIDIYKKSLVMNGLPRGLCPLAMTDAGFSCHCEEREARRSNPFKNWPLGLAGPHQYGNARLALATWRILATQKGWQISLDKERQALAKAFVPGRLQFMNTSTRPSSFLPTSLLPPLLLDGAHNAHGMTALEIALREMGIVPTAVIFACMADKNWQNMLPVLRCIAGDAPIFVPRLNTPRALAPAILAESLNAIVVPSLMDALTEALAKARTYNPILLCGSLYLLGEFFTLFPHYLAPANGDGT